METFNLNFNGGSNILKSICYILSLCCWLLFLITGWISISYLEDNKYRYIWTIPKVEIPDYKFPEYEKTGIPLFDDAAEIAYNKALDLYYIGFYLPIQMSIPFIDIIMIFILIVATLAFLYYFIFSTFKKDSGIVNGMLGDISKFHFIPLACASALFLIGITMKHYDDEKSVKGIIITALIFSLLGLFSLIFIFFKADLSSSIYGNWLIKKTTFGSLIAIFTYSFGYTVTQIGLFNTELSEIKSFKKGAGIGLSIAMGLFNLIIAFVLKEVMISFINILIYIGMTIYYFSLSAQWRKVNGQIEGIFDIIIIVLSALVIALIAIKYKSAAFK